MKFTALLFDQWLQQHAGAELEQTGRFSIHHSLILIYCRAMQFYRWRKAVPLLAQQGGNVPEGGIGDNGQSI
jgi:hypothetical protein